jgi:tetratricopeptide (TPR) repeat protein/predicted Ser/Thr protein kinase
MTQHTCPRGHTWETAPTEAAGAEAPPACPVCASEAPAAVPNYATILPGAEAADDNTSQVDAYQTSYGYATAQPQPYATVPPSSETVAAPSKRRRVVVPGYEILCELGRGGMGVVYQARQRDLNRLVALKMVLAGEHADSQQLERFLTEAQAIARLQHPNIVQVYEIGEHEGLPFFSLEYCGGGSLERKLHETPLLPRDAATLVEVLARAMYAAHEKGVIHRDLKPSNILLSETETPKVADFGLARKLDEQGISSPGDVMGTASYMAPEQAQGRTKEVGPGCDIYSLGAILYECLVGRPPFKAATTVDTIRQVVADEPVPPTRLNPKVPRDLETICLKCLEKESGKRYPTAQALADDLHRFTTGEAILARPTSTVERAVKWARRRPAAAALIAVSVAATLALLVGSGGHTWIVVEQNAELVKQRQQAEAVASLLESVFRRHNPQEVNHDVKAELAGRLTELTAELDKQDVEPVTRARLRTALGVAQQGLGHPKEALALHELALKERTEHLGPTHRDTLASVNHVANAYWYMGQLDKAVEYFDKAYSERHTAFGADDLDTLESMNDLAIALNAKKQTDKALPLIEEALAKRKVHPKLGPEHPLTLESQNNVAVIYQSAGQPAKAIPLLEDTLEKQKRNLSPDHPYTLTTLNNLAVAHEAAGQRDKAIPLYVQALERLQATLSASHPTTLSTMANLANAYAQTGNLKQALPLYELAFEKLTAGFPPEYPLTFTVTTNLAASYKGLGLPGKALPLYLKVVEKRRTELGADDRCTLQAQCYLATLYQEDRQNKKAIALFEETLQKQKDKLPADDPDILLSMNNLAFVYQQDKQLKKAIPLFETALARRRATLPADDPETLTSIRNLAGAYQEDKQNDKAIPLYEEAFKVAKDKDGLPAFQTQEILNKLMAAYSDMGNHKKACELYEIGLSVRKAKGITPEILKAMGELAMTYWTKVERLDKALPLLEEAYHGWRKLRGPDQEITILAMTNFALALQTARRSDESEALSRQILNYRLKKSAQSPTAVVDARGLHALNLLRLKKFEEAEPLLRQNVDFLVKKYPKLWNTADARSMLGGALAGLKNYEEAEPLLLEGYQGLDARKDDLTKNVVTRDRVGEAFQRVVDFYDATGQPKKAAEWRSKQTK